MRLKRLLCLITGHRWQADEWIPAPGGGKLVLRLRCRRCGDVVRVQQHFSPTRPLPAKEVS